MGITCEIKLFKTSDGVVKPGGAVAGILKFTLDADTILNKITLSLKGGANLLLKHKKRENNLLTQRKSEKYFDIDYIIYMNQTGEALKANSYETKFNFTVPDNIPPSLKCSKVTMVHSIQCFIRYFVRVKFEKPGMTKSVKKFHKEIKLVSVMSPTLPEGYTIYGEQTAIPQFMTRKNGIVNVKACIDKSTVTICDKIKAEFEIQNGTKHTIRQVIISLVEKYAFRAKKIREVVMYQKVENASFESSGISAGDTKIFDLDITIPSDLYTIEYSKLVSRQYFLMIYVELRMKQYNVIKIPIQISEEVQNIVNKESLPTYWELLLEDNFFQPGITDMNNSEDE